MINQRHLWYEMLNILITIFLSVSVLLNSFTSNAHLLHIDHNDFRANVFHRPHLSPEQPQTLNELSQHLQSKELTPSEYMVDLTNELAFRILHYHSILNRNNFAFSPTALMSVLVAIYEGSAGQSMSEIKTVLRFPSNRDVIRVGYRDIHRRLRTYFFDSDNPLKGLSLNKENVTITRDYETLLMFYGYDLGIDMVSSTAIPITTTVSTTQKETSLKTSKENVPPKAIEMETITTWETITNPTLTTSSSKSSTETSTIEKEVITSTTQENVTTVTPKETTEHISDKNTVESSTATSIPINTPTFAETTEVSIKPKTEPNEAVELISSFAAEESLEPFSRIQKARVTLLPNAKLQAPLASKIKPQINYLPVKRKSSFKTRSKRHLFDLKDFNSNVFVTLFDTESQLHSPLTIDSYQTGLPPAYVQLSNNFEVYTDPNFIVSSQPSSNFKQNYNADIISHVFYLHNKHIIYTTFKVYNAVLYYKYFDHLKMSVLELELDTPEYNLLILLPDYNTDLLSAASSLRAGPKLRLIRKQLKPKWVQAIIPDFKLHGTMFLTNDLQNLGIYNIFEPNRADFRPMTDEKGIYVKHIEQSINVHIRTNPINQLRRNNGAQTQPIQISVNHPFMFFIIDRDLDVAVMAGRILNPLNVRVQ